MNLVEQPESCGPQLLPEGEPNSEWGVDQLGVYAQVEHQKIIDGEQCLTVLYWRLGLALSLAKKNSAHGQWQRYLQYLRIEKTRASKACAIYGTFEQVDGVRGLSVADAYSQRKHKRTSSPTPDAHQHEPAIATFIARTCKQAEALIDEAAFLEHDKAIALAPALREAIDRMTKLLGYLDRPVT